MRAVIQRVQQATVHVNSNKIASIQKGLLIFLGIEDADGDTDMKWLTNKIINLRIFDDTNKIPNLSVKEIDGELLLVSQFTLHASTKKGNRPSYIKAAKPTIAEPLYQIIIKTLEQALGKKIGTGIFGADMKVSLINDGPITILIDTKNKE